MPTFDIEDSLNGVVAGIDEAGRGPLCGPVFASCVILLDKKQFPKNIDDSKKISENNREKIFNEILNFEKNGLILCGVASVDAEKIDEINIREATKLAMRNSYYDLVNKYSIKVDNVLVDGNFIPNIDTNAIPIIKGDQRSFSIACASIIAKVLRDKELKKMDKLYPMYDWLHNKGYGTKKHIQAIEKHGLVKGYHRTTFCKNFTF